MTESAAPLLRQGSQGCPHGLRRQVERLSFLAQEREPAILNDELQRLVTLEKKTLSTHVSSFEEA